MNHRIREALVALCLASFAVIAGMPAFGQGEPTVQAVLFYSPTCPHCIRVITELLQPMVRDYGEQLQILAIDTSQEVGAQLYLSALEAKQVPPERRGVPLLVVGDSVLVGEREIPDRFPGIVDNALAANGIDWPVIPGLDLAFPDLEPQSRAQASENEATQPAVSNDEDSLSPQAAPEDEPTASGSPATDLDQAHLPPPSDPVGMAIASVVLAALSSALVFAVHRLRAFRSMQRLDVRGLHHWVLPVIVLIGLGVAGYLVTVDLTQAEAACGPIGACNLVQSSSYARVLGIPVALLGVLSYMALGALWLVGRVEPWEGRVVPAFITLSLIGTLFSAYLTIVELFVIRAVCLWCLSSAVASAALLTLAVAGTTRRDVRRGSDLALS